MGTAIRRIRSIPDTPMPVASITMLRNSMGTIRVRFTRIFDRNMSQGLRGAVPRIQRVNPSIESDTAVVDEVTMKNETKNGRDDARYGMICPSPSEESKESEYPIR